MERFKSSCSFYRRFSCKQLARAVHDIAFFLDELLRPVELEQIPVGYEVLKAPEWSVGPDPTTMCSRTKRRKYTVSVHGKWRVSPRIPAA